MPRKCHGQGICVVGQTFVSLFLIPRFSVNSHMLILLSLIPAFISHSHSNVSVSLPLILGFLCHSLSNIFRA